MTEEQIQQFLDDLTKRALDKGLASPTFKVEITNNSQPSGWYYYMLSEAGGSKSEWVYGDNALNVLQQMQLAIASVATKAEREQAEYLKRIASAIEYGKKIGIDEQFINPLELQMKKLSSNIIEYRPDATAAAPFGDEIPF